MGGGTATQHLNPSHTAALACDGDDSYWNAGLMNQIACGVFFVLVSASSFFWEIGSTHVGDNACRSCGGEEMDFVLSGLT